MSDTKQEVTLENWKEEIGKFVFEINKFPYLVPDKVYHKVTGMNIVDFIQQLLDMKEKEVIKRKNSGKTKRYAEKYKNNEEFRIRRRAASLKSYYKRKNLNH